MILPPTPAELYAELFEAVQRARLFADGKAFCDAEPRLPPEAILAGFRAAPPTDAAGLRRFVDAHFDLPAAPPLHPPARGSLREAIAATWDVLTRSPAVPRHGGSALAVTRRHVVPGGRFRELYYWDSWFTMLGLAADGRHDLVEDMIDVFTDLIERYGHVPNGTRSYYLGRSQPPVYALMVALSRDADRAVAARRLAAMVREHGFWMRGAEVVAPGEASARVVRLGDGALLNRYRDDREGPRDESWREDVATAQAAARPAAQVHRDLRAAAESGWDFSSRWMPEGGGLASIRTTRIVPVDLNSLLYLLEQAIAERSAALGDEAAAMPWTVRAEARRTAIYRHLWSANAARYGDLDLASGRLSPVIGAALLFPLFAGVADLRQAAATATLVEARLLAPGGLRTTTCATGEQWDAPNGWAPLQWIAVEGLARYGHDALARRIAGAWLGTVARHHAATGRLLEKYDVECGGAGEGGEYAVQDGFGWTNGVAAALLDRYGTPAEP